MVAKLYKRITEILDTSSSKQEAEALFEAAQELGVIGQFPVFQEKIGKRTHGAEHLVCFHRGRVFKATNWGQFGTRGSPRAYLRRLIIANWLFGDSMQLEGIEADPFGRLRIVISQDFIVGDMATEEVVAAEMQRYGFDSKDGFWWRRQFEGFGVVVGDLHPDNVFVTCGGELVVIDCLIDVEPVEAFQRFFI